MPPKAEARMPLRLVDPTGQQRRHPRDPSGAARRASEYGVLSEIGANDPELDDLEINYFRGGGCFEVVVGAAHRIVGCGTSPLNPCRAELGKMYIEKAARGRWVGKAAPGRFAGSRPSRRFSRGLAGNEFRAGRGDRLVQEIRIPGGRIGPLFCRSVTWPTCCGWNEP